jgi:hypothetical protein
VSEGIRTPDRLDHNQELYQLSYAHRVFEDRFTTQKESSTRLGRLCVAMKALDRRRRFGLLCRFIDRVREDGGGIDPVGGHG